MRKALVSFWLLAVLLLFAPATANALDAGLTKQFDVCHTNHSTGLEAAIYWGLLAVGAILAVTCSMWLAKKETQVGKIARPIAGLVGLVAVFFHAYGLHYFTSTEMQTDHIKGSLMMGIGAIFFILGFLVAVFPNPSNVPAKRPNIQGRIAKSTG